MTQVAPMSLPGRLERMGSISCPSTLTYLDEGVVFVGSAYGDSQLIKLKTEGDFKTDATGSYLDVLEEYPNLGPIIDACIVDINKQGQHQLVTCSGFDKVRSAPSPFKFRVSRISPRSVVLLPCCSQAYPVHFTTPGSTGFVATSSPERNRNH